MTMSYSVKENETGTCDIYEKDSDILIELSRSEGDARGICRKLNLGSGFAGWTPAFVAAGMQMNK